MEHTKRNFRAQRETIGMSKQLLADIMDVDIRSVRRWERVDLEGYPPPDAAWLIIEGYRDQQRKIVDFALAKVHESEMGQGETPEVVTLRYFTTDAEYKVAHPEDSEISLDMANANTRILAYRLSELNYTVEFN